MNPKYLLLDSGPLSLLASPARTPEVKSIVRWAVNCDRSGKHTIVPEIVDYEIRRELLRAGKSAGVRALNALQEEYTFLPLTSDAMREAAELWAEARRRGRPTSDVENIDVDVILAAQARTMGVSPGDVIVVTANRRHLSLFVNADLWTNIAP